MDNTYLLNQYRTNLASLCSFCAKLAILREQIEDGEVVSEEEISHICDEIVEAKKYYLSAKEKLGYTDGLSFMENNRFAGFQITDGVVKGDFSKLYLIIEPWYHSFPEKANNYQYEVANYLLAYMFEVEQLKTKTHVQPVKKMGLFSYIQKYLHWISVCTQHYVLTMKRRKV